MGDEHVRFPHVGAGRVLLRALVTAIALCLATPGALALAAHPQLPASGPEAGTWGAVLPWASLTVVLAVVISGLLMGARGTFRQRQRPSVEDARDHTPTSERRSDAWSPSPWPASYRPLAAMCFLGAGVVHLLIAPEHFLGAGVVHLLVAPEHFRAWWGYGWFFLGLATFQTLYGLGLAAPAGSSPRREAYLLVGITANLLVLGLYTVTRTRGIPLFGPLAGELEPLSVPDLLAAALEIGALALLTRDLRRVAGPRRTMAPLLRCVGPAAAAILALAVCTSPSAHGEHDSATGSPAGHPAQGLPLSAGSGQETVMQGRRCPPGAPVRAYRVAAINVEITLNRFLDYDPKGRMYVLEEELDRVRQEEARNREARAGTGDPAISRGLQGDAIQPLTIRVNQGECLRVALRNALDNDEPASFHLHGSALYVTATGAPALAANPHATASPGASVTYEWWVSEHEPEGTHYFHSHGNTRLQTAHGLFGAIIVEPRGSRHLDPVKGEPLHSGWAAIIQDPRGPAFREFALYYHEVGNERYRHLDRQGALVVQVDPYTSAYRPGDRAMNYRSEPFMNRLTLQQQTFGRFDKSAAYSSYVFGDPATPIARSYLGDPVKQRVVHGGSEVFHVHHVHGGSIRWRRQPGAELTGFDRGLDKHPPLRPQATERIDSQAIGPSETYDVEHECGSGGCQHGAGDYLVHCHVAHHYIAGMWMIWRVYNTKQDGTLSLDSLPPLAELPDRAGQMEQAVTSRELVGRTVNWKGKTFHITWENLGAWVERQLPPRGVPRGYDASVLDWVREGDVYLNEPETDQSWPGYQSATPNARPPLYFDPRTGKLAYPFLRPHLAKRPPFAPNHGPAPFLEPIQGGMDPPAPGENGPWSLCPEGSNRREFTIHAITLPVPLNQKARLLDPSGQLYILKEEEEAVRGDDVRKVPLAIRANAGEDCVDILFKSELPDSRENAFFSKVNIHIHFAQFDIQGSDGVTTGFNYEQSVRPFATEGEALASPAAAGITMVRVGSTARFQPGILVGVGMDQDRTFEVKRVLEVGEDALVLDEPLRYPHAAGEVVSTEFVRYRYYPDVQFGTAYFHDHVDGLTAWKHGLFGALIAEPPGSTYHDPRTGVEIRSGPVADIHTESVVSADVAGSFRELVLFIQDDNIITRLDNSSGSSYNLRVEPIGARGRAPPEPFSSAVYGDPETPVLEAQVGDPVVVRTLVAGSNDVHTWHLDGHWFRTEPYSPTSPPVNTVHLGISERYDLVIPRAGGPQGRPGDYVYRSGRIYKLREGSWGLLRVHPPGIAGALRPLPGRQATSPPAEGLCPQEAPRKDFVAAAITVPLPMLGGSRGAAYVLEKDRAAVVAGSRPPEPLVLHVNVGDCLEVRLRNDTDAPVSLHADLLAYDPADTSPVPPGEVKTYTFFAHPEVGETAALLRDTGNVLENPRLGLYGAIIVGSPGTRYYHPASGEDLGEGASWAVDAHPVSGTPYRDFSLFLQDEDEVIGTAQMPYNEQVRGLAGLNYSKEPLARRLVANKDTAKLFRSAIHGDPVTPLIEAFAGDRVRLHLFVPFSEQAHVFSLEGHRWPLEPGCRGTDMRSSLQLGGLATATLHLADGAGGAAQAPGDHIYGDHREPYRDAGLWGLFRIHGRGAPGVRLQRLERP
jgi:FtsP/CotA-like multicopper oxidase with cupredoxin domain